MSRVSYFVLLQSPFLLREGDLLAQVMSHHGLAGGLAFPYRHKIC